MSEKNFASYGDMETLVTEIASKCGPSNIIQSYVGMIIHSTTLNTEAKVKEVYGTNTSWILHSGYVLRGASSGVVANSAVKTDGEDTHTLIVEEMPSHTHIQDSHNHTQNSHNHTQNAHDHSFKGTSHRFGPYYHTLHWGDQKTNTTTTKIGDAESATGAANNRWVNTSWTDGGTVGSKTATNIATTATNQATTATNQATIATNQNTGGGKAHNNLPSYKSVYIWERIA